MISRAALDQRVREWGLRHEVVEKDYVLGWLLWGIGSDPVLRETWVFKGGTCLKKCYIETYRFSEDLDFTVLSGGQLDSAELQPVLNAVLQRVSDASGLDFSVEAPRLRQRPGGSVEGRIYYRGPLAAPGPASVKLDLSADEILVRSLVRRPIAHSYEPEEQLPDPAEVTCYSFEEVFAEKLRAMGERSRPRDLYDIVNLYRRDDLRLRRDDIFGVLVEKCAHKGIDLPTAELIRSSGRMPELESEWENMLGHQLPVLPPLDTFVEVLEELFAWLHGAPIAPALPAITLAADEDRAWTPPPTVAVWGTRVPLEEVRFAAVNHLCVELRYKGTSRLIEPYSLRRTLAGNLVLHAERADGSGHRSYRVDRIEGAHATSVPFRPRHAIEFSAAGPMAASTQTRIAPRTSVRRVPRTGREYVVECPRCGRRFTRTTPGTRLRPHNDSSGYPCPGRSGRRAW